MSALAVNPVEAEWLEAVYKLTGAPRPAADNGAPSEENTKLKPKLEKQYTDLQDRLSKVKGSIPAALRGKLDLAVEDLKADYKLSAVESRLKEIEEQLGTLEKEGFAGDSKEWATEIRTSTDQFAAICKQAEGALVKRAQQRAQELAKAETDPIRKKRLTAAAQEAGVDFIAVPLERIATRFGQDLQLGGEKQKAKIRKQYDQELAETRADIEKVIAGNRFVAVVRREQKPREQKRDKEAMGRAAAAVTKKIAVLGELDAARAKQYQDRLNAADSLKKVTKIASDIEGSLGRREVDPTEIAAKQKALDAKADAVGKVKNAKKGEEKAKLRDLENGLNGAKALAATGNKKVMEAAEKLAEEMAAAAADPNVGKLFKTIEDLKKELGDKNLKLFYPKEQVTLIEALKKLGAEVDPLDLEPSQTALARVSETIKYHTDQTEVRLQWQKKIESTLGTTGYHLGEVCGDGMIIKGKADKTGLGQKLKELRVAYKAPDAVMKHVDNQVATLWKQVDELYVLSYQAGGKAAVGKSLEVERKKFEKIEAARKNRATALKELKGKRQGLEKALKAEESRVKGDPALEDDVARALEIVKSAKQMGKAKQLEEATRKVAVAQERLDKVKAKAPGAAGDATVYLRDQAPTGWKNAVEGISAQIAEIQKDAMELADLAKVNGGQVAKVIGDMAGKVLGEGVFASSFQGPIKELIAAPDQNKKKAAREKVIAEIGYLRKQLDSNPVLLQLRVNPFNKKISTTKVRAFLDMVELKTTEVLRGK